MKLKRVQSGGFRGLPNRDFVGIDEHTDFGHVRRQVADDRGGLFRRYVSRAGFVKHETKRIGTGVDRRQRILRRGDPANFHTHTHGQDAIAIVACVNAAVGFRVALAKRAGQTKCVSAEPTMAYVALGANIGDPVETVRLAAAEIVGASLGQALGSSLWQTEPVDCPPGSPPFSNAALGFEANPGTTPESLLEWLLQLEARLGRQRTGLANEPRKIDLDLIAFGDEQRNTVTLILPHPRAHERQFVLGPLAEIAPGLTFPGQTKTVQTLLDELPDQGALKSDELLL